MVHVMVASNEIEAKVEQMDTDEVFSVADLGFPPDWYDNVRIKLSRMVVKGQIVKVGKGRYYKPRQTMFGALQPSREEIVKDLLVKDGKPVGYFTGYSIWNKMGLTTQVPSVIEIGSQIRKNKTNRGSYSIRFVLQPNDITRVNIPLLQILDTVKAVKSIPDTTINDSVSRLSTIFNDLSDKDVALLATLSLKYSPQTRALVGALLEPRLSEAQATKLRNSLNPMTVYKLGISNAVMPNQNNWYIV